MKKILASSLVILTLVAHVSHAEEKKGSTSGFWDKLRSKIEQMAPQKKLTATTAVGGVRGAKMAADDVYWKGEKVPSKVDADELETFKQAMALAEAGEEQKAQDAFATFIKKNPESPLRKDAEQALTQLQGAK